MYFLNRTFSTGTYYYSPYQLVSPKYTHKAQNTSLLTTAIYKLFHDLTDNNYDPNLFARLIPIIIHKDPVGFAFELQSGKKFLLIQTKRINLTTKEMSTVKIPIQKIKSHLDLLPLPNYVFMQDKMGYALNQAVERSGVIRNKSVIRRLRNASSSHFVLKGAAKTTHNTLLSSTCSRRLSIESAKEYIQHNVEMIKLIPALTSTQSFIEVLNNA